MWGGAGGTRGGGHRGWHRVGSRLRNPLPAAAPGTQRPGVGVSPPPPHPPTGQGAEGGGRAGCCLPRRLSGAGEQSWHRGKRLNLARFPASAEPRRSAPAGRGATVAAVHLSRATRPRTPPPHPSEPTPRPGTAPPPPPGLGRGVGPLWGEGWGAEGWGVRSAAPGLGMPSGLGGLAIGEGSWDPRGGQRVRAVRCQTCRARGEGL